MGQLLWLAFLSLLILEVAIGQKSLCPNENTENHSGQCKQMQRPKTFWGCIVEEELCNNTGKSIDEQAKIVLTTVKDKYKKNTTNSDNVITLSVDHEWIVVISDSTLESKSVYYRHSGMDAEQAQHHTADCVCGRSVFVFMYQGHKYAEEHAPKCDKSMRKSAEMLIDNALKETENKDDPELIANEIDRGRTLHISKTIDKTLYFRRGAEHNTISRQKTSNHAQSHYGLVKTDNIRLGPINI